MDGSAVELRVAAELRTFLAPRHRGGDVRAAYDGASSLGHVIESLGIPLPEVGRLTVDGHPVPGGCRPRPGDVVTVDAWQRPRRLPSARFLLDVHLGALARQLRLVGIDTRHPPQLPVVLPLHRVPAGLLARGAQRAPAGHRGRRDRHRRRACPAGRLGRVPRLSAGALIGRRLPVFVVPGSSRG